MYPKKPLKYGVQDIDIWPSYGGINNDDYRWRNNNQSDDEEDMGPDPTHKCPQCSTKSYIKSERHRNFPRYCEECESVTQHQPI